VVFDDIPDFCPARCAKCQDAFAAKVIADRRKAEARQAAEFAGISERFLSYDKAKDARGYLPWIKANRTKSLFLAGESGQGKTHCLGYAGYRSILDYGDHVMFLRFPEWLRATGALMGHDAYQAEKQVSRAKEAGLLILDDLGKEKLTERASEIVWDLIDLREREKRRTWISSNHNGKELRARLGEDKGETILVRLKRGYEEFK
jgi:DNA replication protein DnaC